MTCTRLSNWFAGRGAWLPCVSAFALLWCSFLSVVAQDSDSEADFDQLTPEQQEQVFMKMVEDLGWKRQGVGDLDKWAEIKIPQGFRFTEGDGAAQLMEIYGNPSSETETGVIAPEDLNWFVLFRFEDSGYVKDDEKDKINPAKILKEKKENQELSNEYRRENGLQEMYVMGWAVEPNYNEATNNLEWALDLQDADGNRVVNFNTKLLGRHGVMDSTLVCDPGQLDELLPTYQNLIAGFSYKPGNTYAEYKEGDKIAKYGLLALIGGGGAALAAKAGLFAVIGKFLAKAWKLVAVGVVAVGAFLKRIFTRR